MRQRWRLSQRWIPGSSEHFPASLLLWLVSIEAKSCGCHHSPGATPRVSAEGHKDRAVCPGSSRRWLSQTSQHSPSSASTAAVLTWKQGHKVGKHPVPADLPSPAAQCVPSVSGSLWNRGNVHSWGGEELFLWWRQVGSPCRNTGQATWVLLSRFFWNGDQINLPALQSQTLVCAIHVGSLLCSFLWVSAVWKGRERKFLNALHPTRTPAPCASPKMSAHPQQAPVSSLPTWAPKTISDHCRRAPAPCSLCLPAWLNAWCFL